jgi:hypothetical protein
VHQQQQQQQRELLPAAAALPLAAASQQQQQQQLVAVSQAQQQQHPWQEVLWQQLLMPAGCCSMPGRFIGQQPFLSSWRNTLQPWPLRDLQHRWPRLRLPAHLHLHLQQQQQQQLLLLLPSLLHQWLLLPLQTCLTPSTRCTPSSTGLYGALPGEVAAAAPSLLLLLLLPLLPIPSSSARHHF